MKLSFWIALTLAAVLAVSIPIFLQRQIDANLLADEGWRFVKAEKAKGKLELFRADELSQPKAYRFLLGSFFDDAEHILFENTLPARDDKAGEQMTLRFWARSQSNSSILLRLQGESLKDPIAWQRFLSLGPKWHRYRYTFTPKAIGAGPKSVRFLLGGEAGVIDLCDIQFHRGERLDPPNAGL